MAETRTSLFDRRARVDWVRLRTLVTVRWMAIAGQLAAILFSIHILDLRIPVGACFGIVAVSVALNVLLRLTYPENTRLSERQVLFFLLYDILQLSLLLALTGGLSNPFALLIVAPVTISATALGLVSTITTGGVAVLLITIVAFWNVPLRTADGTAIGLPPLFLLGFWVALVVGVVVLAGYARRVTVEIHTMSAALSATQLALSREQKLTDLSGVVAAAAHELGTPLATIKLVSTELAEELGDNADLKADVELIREQADRCRDILRDMGRAGKDDRQLAALPLAEIVRTAAEPHLDRGKEVVLNLPQDAEDLRDMPILNRSPEIVHGLRNLVQNAVDFAHDRVWIDIDWTDTEVRIVVADNGRGYPPDLIGRIGDPFVRRRSPSGAAERPGYEGMGLGLFIAKTLLERTGAALDFRNGRQPGRVSIEGDARCGAIVEVVWPRARIEADSAALRAPLGENPRIGF